jgi:hypothetical protein
VVERRDALAIVVLPADALARLRGGETAADLIRLFRGAGFDRGAVEILDFDAPLPGG